MWQAFAVFGIAAACGLIFTVKTFTSRRPGGSGREVPSLSLTTPAFRSLNTLGGEAYGTS